MIFPEEWDVVSLGDVVQLGHGFAFSSEYFSDKGPILLTPGNFKLEGGLYFEARNTKRFSGFFNKSMVLKGGDLVIVMTDLTPNCNLLGKPAFVSSDGIILHNQRIGKVKFLGSKLLPKYLFYTLLSPIYLSKVKESATGSTVRHTSNKSIYKIKIPLPPIEEQKAIAKALSDVDALINSLDQLIAKKRDIKQGAMQELLTGKTRLPGFDRSNGTFKQTDVGMLPSDWECELVVHLAEISTGGKNTQDKVDDGQFPFFVRSQKIECINSYSFDGEAVLTAGDGVGTGKVFHYINGKFDVHQRVYQITNFKNNVDGYFFFLYFSLHFYNRIMQMTAKSSVDSVRMDMIAKMPIPLPKQEEQKAIAQVLSDMDAEIQALEARRDKTKRLKQGMMQELLTGRTRLL